LSGLVNGDIKNESHLTVRAASDHPEVQS
jgi:hypothetical protein